MLSVSPTELSCLRPWWVECRLSDQMPGNPKDHPAPALQTDPTEPDFSVCMASAVCTVEIQS